MSQLHRRYSEPFPDPMTPPAARAPLTVDQHLAQPHFKNTETCP